MVGLIEEQSLCCVDVLGVNQKVIQLRGLSTVVAQFHAWHQGEKKKRTLSFAPGLGVFRPRVGSYWASRTSPQLRHGGHMRGFVLWDGGLLGQVETHTDVPRITKNFDD